VKEEGERGRGNALRKVKIVNDKRKMDNQPGHTVKAFLKI
jgi:hypothetical protein